MNFTQHQDQALRALGKNTIVSAGAGSGKTAVLSEKVKYLISEKGFHLSEMLILTFTNLAAGEMKERIRKKLKNGYKEEANMVDLAYICTFDAFALSLVKQYHLLLGLDENISIVSAGIMSVKISSWIEEEFLKRYENKDKDFLMCVDKCTFKNDNELKDLVFSLVEKFTQEGLDEHLFKVESEEKLNSSFEEMILEAEAIFIKTRDEIYEDISELAFSDPKILYEYGKDYFEASTFDDFIRAAEKKLPRANFKNIDEDEIDFARLVAKRIQDFKKLISTLRTKASLKEEYLLSKKFELILLQIAREVYNKEMQFKKDKGCYEFGDIASLAYSLLKENEDIRLRLKNKFKIIMVDEYQDTSLAQERFLNLITQDNCFMVGDLKQSIYRFRYARPEIFSDKYDSFADENKGIRINLNENFRSRKEVIDDINFIFERIMTRDIGGCDYKKEHLIVASNKDFASAGEDYHPLSEKITYDNIEGVSSAETEARHIAQDILRKREQGKVLSYDKDTKPILIKPSFSSFCLLSDRVGEFPTYQRVFEEYGIPLVQEYNEDIKENMLIEVMKNALTLLYKVDNNLLDTDFKHAFVSLARSFIYEMKDDEIYKIVTNSSYETSLIYKDAIEILKARTNNSLSELYNLFVAKKDIYNNLIKIGNVEKNMGLLSIFENSFKEMDTLKYSLDEAINYLKALYNLDLKLVAETGTSSTNAVKMMNIHKSKGLEFPIVYFTGLYKRFNASDIRKKTGLSKSYGILLPNENKETSLAAFLNKQKEAKDDLSERIRLFYVALTRAKEQMIFLIPNQENKIKRIEQVNSFLDLINFVPDLELKEASAEMVVKTNVTSEDTKKELPYLDITFDNVEEKVEKKKASKNISFDAKIENLRFGERLHFLLKVIDFDTQDTSFIENSFEKNVIERFFKSRLFLELIKGDVYKEFEFENNEHKGIIDCFSVLDNRIILLDYKLKNISDDAYNEQIKTYAEYLTKLFKKPVESYLYALLTGIEERIDITI